MQASQAASLAGRIQLAINLERGRHSRGVDLSHPLLNPTARTPPFPRFRTEEATDVSAYAVVTGRYSAIALLPTDCGIFMKAAGLAILLVDLRFPVAEFGLPDGCENLNMIHTTDLLSKFLKAIGALQEPLMAQLHEQQRSLPSCIISDMINWWTGDIARELGIPRLAFIGFCGFSSLVRHITFHTNVFEHVKDENELVTITGFPTPLELTKAKSPGGLSIPGAEQIHDKILEEALRCDGDVINSFQEHEALYIESFEQMTGKKSWTIGPMCLCHRNTNTVAARGNKASTDEAHCLQWLDSMKPGSVVFGSLACTTPQQLVELGLGLEASQKPFICVIKAEDKLPRVEEWLADGFEERVKNRGMIIRGWVPQVMILWHQAIGGFVTHCGWNPTIEGICAGVPMITWPHFVEQFVNEKQVVDVLKIGVEVGVQGVTQWGSENQEVMVTRDAMETAVNTLMDEGEAAEELSVRAKDYAIMAMRTFDEEGSSYNNIRLLIQEMGNKTDLRG